MLSDVNFSQAEMLQRVARQSQLGQVLPGSLRVTHDGGGQAMKKRVRVVTSR